MRIINRFFMIVSTGLLVFLTDFTPPSPILLYCVVGVVSASYMCDRHLSKSHPTTMYLPGWTVYRVNGKARLRRKADYKKIHEMELQLGIIETPKPTPPPRPSDSARSARPQLPVWEIATRKGKEVCGISPLRRR